MDGNNGIELKKKSLKGIDIFLGGFCAMLFIDTLAPAVAMGPSVISWWLIAGLIYYVPYGLVTAELGSTYPDQGGLYSWVKRSFGNKWGARTSYLYWVNNALWVPSVYIYFAGFFSKMFFPSMSLWTQIIIGIILIWITMFLGTKSMDESKWVTNIAAVLKISIIALLGIAAVIYIIKGGAIANNLAFENILPKWDEGLTFLPVIIYNYLGFEVMSASANEMQNPQKDVPKSILSSAVGIIALYLIGTIGILVIMPIDSLNIVEGLVDTFSIVFGNSGFGGIFTIIIGVAALYTFFAQTLTWAIGGCRGAAEAGAEGELPKVFGKMHKENGTPVGALIITGIVGTVILLLYGFMAGSAEELFWTLFAFSTMIFLFPYIIMFASFLKLRKIDKDRTRPFKVPGGKLFSIIIFVLCQIILIGSVVLFIWVPGETIDWSFALPVLIGLVVTIVIGEVLVGSQLKKNSHMKEVER